MPSNEISLNMQRKQHNLAALFIIATLINRIQSWLVFVGDMCKTGHESSLDRPMHAQTAAARRVSSVDQWGEGRGAVGVRCRSQGAFRSSTLIKHTGVHSPVSTRKQLGNNRRCPGDIYRLVPSRNPSLPWASTSLRPRSFLSLSSAVSALLGSLSIAIAAFCGSKQTPSLPFTRTRRPPNPREMHTDGLV